jgi:hypothetical protein
MVNIMKLKRRRKDENARKKFTNRARPAQPSLVRKASVLSAFAGPLR